MRAGPHEAAAHRAELRWLQADLFDGAALEAAGVTTGRLQGVLELTCLRALDPGLHGAYSETAGRLLAPAAGCSASSGAIPDRAVPPGAATLPPWPNRCSPQASTNRCGSPHGDRCPHARMNGWGCGGGEGSRVILARRSYATKAPTRPGQCPGHPLPPSGLATLTFGQLAGCGRPSWTWKPRGPAAELDQRSDQQCRTQRLPDPHWQDTKGLNRHEHCWSNSL